MGLERARRIGPTTLKPPDSSLDPELVGLHPVLRRFARAAGLDADAADDVAQEVLLRLLANRARLDRSTLTSYAIVIARNAVTSLRRAEDRADRHRHRLLDPPTASLPEEEVLRAEEHAALASGLARLTESDRALLGAYELSDRTAGTLAQQIGVSRPTLAVRLSRARARLRVEYVLALRRIQPPTDRCRPVLLSLSTGDRRRQRELGAGAHLLTCATCGAVAEPLLRRSRRLASLIPWVGLVALGRFVRRAAARRPVQIATATATAAGVTAVAIVAGGHHQPGPPAGQPAILSVAGRPLTPADAAQLHRHAGQAATARGAPVLSVPADEGFWAGGAGASRVWVQLIGRGESPETVRPGDRVSFRGVVVTNPSGYGRRVGLGATSGSGLLAREGAHIEVSYVALRLDRRPARRPR